MASDNDIPDLPFLLELLVYDALLQIAAYNEIPTRPCRTGARPERVGVGPVSELIGTPRGRDLQSVLSPDLETNGAA